MRFVIVLLAVTAVWGWTFVVVKADIAQYPALTFLGLRFALAALFVAALVRRLPSRRTLALGAVIGVALSAGYLCQTIGLEYTSAGNAGLITGLFVVFTPLLDGLTGRRVPARTLVAIVPALAGTALLAGVGSARIGLGDLLMVGCAVAFSVHIVLLSRWSPEQPSADLTLAQMLTAALLFGAAGAPGLRPPCPTVWFGVVVTGVLASGLAFFIQTWAQRHLPAGRTALILATEPAWALAFSVLLTGQRLGPAQAAGAVLLVGAILGHELAHAAAGRNALAGSA